MNQNSVCPEKDPDELNGDLFQFGGDYYYVTFGVSFKKNISRGKTRSVSLVLFPFQTYTFSDAKEVCISVGMEVATVNTAAAVKA